MIKAAVSYYFNSWWIPSATATGAFVCFTLAVFSRWSPFAAVAAVLLIGFGLCVFGILVAAIWNFIEDRWIKGLINLLMFPLTGVGAFVFLLIVSVLGPSEDGFADKLKIPESIEYAEPQDEIRAAPGGPEDSFQTRLLAALRVKGSGDTLVSATADSLVTLQKTAPDILRRYLASSASWRVFEEHGATFATRRWMIGSQWQYDLHGYYSTHDLHLWSTADISRFQSRVTIGLAGKPWAKANSESTLMKPGHTGGLVIAGAKPVYRSHCIITADTLVLEIFEESDDWERRLTKATLACLEEELRPLAASPDWKTIRRLLPVGSVKRGSPSLDLRKSFQPGIYNSEIWANPGESGRLYLRAFEVTRGTPLSAGRLKEYSNEWIGWSDDPAELFLSNTHFTIYEGDWGKPYAARFEVWFVPDSGQPERKLMERAFKIEGWQR
jgi:hypothetical protein